MSTLMPILVMAPVDQPVTLDEVKRHIPGLDFADDDLLLSELLDAAIADLDGWRGRLGRAIMAQTWKVRVETSGDFIMPMPDITEVRATYDDDSTATIEPTVIDGRWQVTADQAGWLEFDCALPAQLLASAKIAVKMLVCHWYDSRGAASNAKSMLPIGLERILWQLRWGHI